MTGVLATPEGSYGRLPKTPLGRSKAWQRPQRRSKDHLLLLLADQQIWLMTLYGKDEAEDLTPQEKKVLRSAIEAELRTREAKRLALEKRLRRKP